LAWARWLSGTFAASRMATMPSWVKPTAPASSNWPRVPPKRWAIRARIASVALVWMRMSGVSAACAEGISRSSSMAEGWLPLSFGAGGCFTSGLASEPAWLSTLPTN